MILVNPSMKMISKKLLFLLAGIILFPSLVFAQNGNQGVEQKIKNFCNQLSNLTSRVDQRASGLGEKLQLKRNEIQNKIQERRENRDVKLEQVREKWDANREEHFTKLEEKAQTEEQKQAVIDFKKAVKDAITARRLAIDTAIDDFKAGTDQAIAERKSAIDKLSDEYESAVKEAITKATTDCASGASAATIRQNLANDLKAARDKFNSEKQALDKLQVEKDQLIAEKKAAFDKAISDFKVAMEKARNDFKNSFSGENTTTEE